jgi:hypothetical protein
MAIKILNARIIDLLSKRTNRQMPVQASPAVTSRRLEPDLNDRADVWVNEGGAGGEFNR